MRRFTFFTILLCFLTMSVFAYRVLDRNVDQVDSLWIIGSQVAWVEYANWDVAVAAGATDVNNVSMVMYYDPHYRSDRIDHILTINTDWEGDFYSVEWNYISYGRVNFIDHPEDITEDSAHPSGYGDLLYFIEDNGWLDPEDIQGSPIFLGIIDKMQEKISYGRIHWGLDVSPETRPNPHEIGVALKGGDWVQFGDNTYEYYIARVDLTAAQNSRDPDISAAFRHQTERRTIIKYGIDDIGVLLDFEPVLANLEEGEIHIDYSRDIVSLKLNSSLAVQASNNTPRFSFISVDPRGGADTEQEWYLARINHRQYRDGILEFRCDSHEKKQEYQDHDIVYVQIQQN